MIKCLKKKPIIFLRVAHYYKRNITHTEKLCSDWIVYRYKWSLKNITPFYDQETGRFFNLYIILYVKMATKTLWCQIV